MSGYDYDVAIIGAGPSGIAAATGLVRAGITNIVVLEREAEVGGIPRHTHHPSFGLLVFKRPVSGPAYIKKLRQRCPDVRFKTSTTVTAIHKRGVLELATLQGAQTIRARHIVLATGARETPRHPRLVSGLRPQGVMTTGALQQFVYAQGLKPFKRVVIVGTELVSFSALWTLRHAGIKPVAMIEARDRITAYRPATLLARLLGVPIHYNSQVVDIAGNQTLAGVDVEDTKGNRQSLACDGVIFSGNFTGDNTLGRASHLALNPDTQIPLMDQNWQTSDSGISVIGNTTHPADMGDQCYIEGLIAGQKIADHLQATSMPDLKTIPIRHDAGIKMTTPSMVRVTAGKTASFTLNLHVTNAYSGPVTVTYDGKTLYQKSHKCLPARRISLKHITIKPAPLPDGTALTVTLGP